MMHDLAGAYGAGVRRQVFEVVVRQALAGAPWQQLCRAPMVANAIAEEEIEQEVNRRKRLPCSPEASTKKYLETVQRDYSQFQAVVNAALDQIAHSQVSPCACTKCRLAVSAILTNTAVEVQKTLPPLNY